MTSDQDETAIVPSIKDDEPGHPTMADLREMFEKIATDLSGMPELIEPLDLDAISLELPDLDLDEMPDFAIVGFDLNDFSR